MSRMMQVSAVVFVMLAASADAAEVVSMKLCAVEDYDVSIRGCAAGKGLEGSSIMIDPSVVKGVYFLTAIKAGEAEEVYHVWIAAGRKSGNVSVFDSTTRTMRDADQSELDWLKERSIEGAQALIKLPVAASSNYRTRSQKTLSPRLAGPWKVQVYDGAKLTPLGELSFTVTAPASTTTEQN